MKAPAYPKYKASGVEWLGEVPEHWEVKRGRFCMRVNPPSERLRMLKPEDEVSFIPMESVGEYGGLNLDVTKPLGEVGTSYTEFQDGDVVVAKITPCFENGKGALASGLTNDAALGTTELHVLRALPALDRRFLFYLTISSVYRKTGEAEMYGAGGQKRVPPEFNKDFRTPLPPLAEQHAIADFLDAETGKLDTLIAKKRELIEKLKEKRTALISRTVTRGLLPEAARAAGLNPPPKFKPSGIEWLGDIPEHWHVSKIRFEAIAVSKGTTPSTIGKEVVDEGIRFIKAENIQDGRVLPDPEFFIDADTDHLLARSRLKQKDIVVVIAGATTGKAAILPKDFLPANTNQAVCFIRLKNTDYAPILAAWMSTKFIQDIVWNSAVQAAQPNLAMEDIKAFPCLIAPLPEQHAMAHFLEHETAKIDRMVQKVEAAIERLQEYRAALITAAVTGKIDVRTKH